MRPKSDLIRVVRCVYGSIKLDKTGKLNGRGAYICEQAQCFAKCRRQKRLDKALGVTVADEIYERLEKAVTGRE